MGLVSLLLLPAAISCRHQWRWELGAGVQPDARQRIAVTPDVVYGHQAGLALTFDLYRPASANGAAVIFINSGGFVSGQLRQCAPVAGSGYRFLESEELMIDPEGGHLPLLRQFSFTTLLARGFTVFDVRHGGSPKFTLDEIVEDLQRAVRFIRTHAAEWAIDPDRIGAWGASAGGYLALYLGLAGHPGDGRAADPSDRADPRVRAVATYYPAGFDWAATARQFPEIIAALPALQIDAARLDALSLKHFVSGDDPPVLMIYGEEDMPLITGDCLALHAALRAQGVESQIIPLPATGHEFRGPEGYDAQHGERAREETARWFERQLGAE